MLYSEKYTTGSLFFFEHPMWTDLNCSHLATRCTSTSVGLLRRDSTLLLKSTSLLQTGDSTQQCRTLSENFDFFSFSSSSFFFFHWMPSCQGLWFPARGVSHHLRGGGWRDSREEYISSLDGMPSSHTLLGPWQTTSSREKALEAEIAPRLICKRSGLSWFLSRKVFFIVFSFLMAADLWQLGGFWYVAKTEIDVGSWSKVLF